jgi:hypothetical protein
MTYLPLARRYRPTSLEVQGKVCDPTPEFPFTVEVRPWAGGVSVTVRSRDNAVYRQVDARSIEDERVEQAVDQMVAQMRAGQR